MNKKESGQAFIGGIILIMIVMFFSAYFLYSSEAYLRLFSNAERANREIVKETSYYANILNEISFNNQNIITAITVAENALLKSLEYSLYISFHQPYWDTYSMLNDTKNIDLNLFFKQGSLSKDTKKVIEKIFKSYSLTSARGFFIAKSLSEKNKQLIQKLPLKIKQYFIQSPNSQTLCFALETQKKYYNSPGILNIPALKIYNFYLKREEKNKCSIEHKTSIFNKILEFSVPVLFSSEKDRILDYSKLEFLSSYINQNYGISYVDPNNKNNFIKSLIFLSSAQVKTYDNKFAIVDKFLSHIKFFKDIHLGQENKLLESPLITKFIIKHNRLYSTNEEFLKSFFAANWSVSGVYE